MNALAIVVLVVVVAVIASVVFGRRKPPVVPVAAGPDDFEEGIVSEPVPITASDSAVTRAATPAQIVADESVPTTTAGSVARGAPDLEPSAEADWKLAAEANSIRGVAREGPDGSAFADGRVHSITGAHSISEERVAQARISWAKQFESRSGALRDDARLRLINDLGMLRASWCVPLLTQALDEETNPTHRDAVEAALTHCRGEAGPVR